MNSKNEEIDMGCSSELVGDFYNRFPFPASSIQEGAPKGAPLRWSVESVYAICRGTMFDNSDSSQVKTILDAGCGTGISTNYLAHLNPEAQILAVDISNTSIDIAKKRLEKSGANRISNVTFMQTSFLDLKDKNKFDYINSIGVLQHLDNPLLGLISLERLLKPGAILHLTIYSEVGRWEINRIRESLQILRSQNIDLGINLSRDLLNHLPEGNKLRNYYFQKLIKEFSNDVDFADAILHPLETSYNLDQAFKLFKSANLQFVGFSNPEIWNLERLLSDELLEKSLQMSLLDQWRLIEQLDPGISHFEVFLAKPPFPSRTLDDSE